MAITHRAGTRTVRETTAPWEYTDETGALQVEDIRVRYISPTLQDLERVRKMMADAEEGSSAWLAKDLSERIDSLPDILDEKGKPVTTDEAFFQTVTLKNLQALQKAYNDDLYPKEQPAT